jgi:hypothetical protein
MMGGDVTVASEPGKGSVFMVRLPGRVTAAHIGPYWHFATLTRPAPQRSLSKCCGDTVPPGARAEGSSCRVGPGNFTPSLSQIRT